MLICINNDIADTMAVNPEILEDTIGDHSEKVEGYEVDKGKRKDHIMTEVYQSEKMFVQE